MEPLQSTLLAYLGQVPDFRHARGQRFAWIPPGTGHRGHRRRSD